MQNLMPPINTPDQLFHDGDPTQGIEGTLVTAGYLNNQQGATRDLQQELLNVLGGAHIQPDPKKTDQLLTALRALLLSRKNPFADIKSDGTVEEALENLGLGEAAKRNVGTGTNQIPDMGSFTLSVSGTGYQKLPSGFILQWGSIGAPGIAQDVVTHFPIAFPNRCLRVLVSQDYTPDSGAVGYIACAGFSPDPVKFISRASTPGLGASFLALGC
ncbi:TPA: gp53-like domain-containing protein [Escherichia coli]